MHKQDRQAVRTVQDLERKYNLGLLAQGGSGSDNNSDQVSKVAQELSAYKTRVNSKIQSIETSIANIQEALGTYGVSVVDDDLDLAEVQEELNVVHELANANKLAHEANAQALITIQEEVDELSATKDESKWKLLTTKTGTTGTVTLPTTFKELHILIGISNYMYTFDILADYLTSTEMTFRNGYALSSSVYGDVYVSVKKSEISAWTVRKENAIQTATVKVYYR